MANRQFCDGWNRRDFLRVGTAGVMGLNISMGRLLQAEAAGAIDKSKSDINFSFETVTVVPAVAVLTE